MCCYTSKDLGGSLDRYFYILPGSRSWPACIEESCSKNQAAAAAITIRCATTIWPPMPLENTALIAPERRCLVGSSKISAKVAIQDQGITPVGF